MFRIAVLVVMAVWAVIALGRCVLDVAEAHVTSGYVTVGMSRIGVPSPPGETGDVGAMIVGGNESAVGPRGPLRYESRPAPELARSPRRAAANDRAA